MAVGAVDPDGKVEGPVGRDIPYEAWMPLINRAFIYFCPSPYQLFLLRSGFASSLHP